MLVVSKRYHGTLGEQQYAIYIISSSFGCSTFSVCGSGAAASAADCTAVCRLLASKPVVGRATVSFVGCVGLRVRVGGRRFGGLLPTKRVLLLVATVVVLLLLALLFLFWRCLFLLLLQLLLVNLRFLTFLRMIRSTSLGASSTATGPSPCQKKERRNVNQIHLDRSSAVRVDGFQSFTHQRAVILQPLIGYTTPHVLAETENAEAQYTRSGKTQMQCFRRSLTQVSIE